MLKTGWIAGLLLVVTAHGAVPQAAVQAAPPAGPDERLLWTLWSVHNTNPADHAAFLAAVRKARPKLTADPLRVVVQGIQAWHLLAAGDEPAARQLLEPWLSPTNPPPEEAAAWPLLTEGARRTARVWLTRLDRETVRDALQVHYRQHVAYPAELKGLDTNAVSLPPLVDRFGRPWVYALTTFRTLPGVEGQRYRLDSSALAPRSDFKTALAAPYAGRILLRPVRLMGAGAGAAVQFSVADEEKKGAASVTLTPGGEAGGVRLIFVGQRLVVLSDGDHWLVLPLPS